MKKHNFCEDCKFYQAFTTLEKSGQCRRYPPRVVLAKEKTPATEFPRVLNTNWCGEFKEQEININE